MRDELRVPEELYAERVKRLGTMIELKAPRYLIRQSASLLERSFKRRGFREWLFAWQVGSTRFPSWPYWLLMLTSPEYRQADREMQDESSR